jgi:DNA-3-methyladenine glycosylase
MLNGGRAPGGCFHDAFGPNQTGMGRIIKAKEVQAKKTVALARWLLGKHLMRRRPDGSVEERMIVETEAYQGEDDLACHARAGRTRRTEVMYASGGVWYVYLCYGMHEMLNLVTGPRDWPAAVLIRGIDGARGPGKTTKAFAIGRELNGADATNPASGLWIEDRGVRVAPKRVTVGPRVGVAFAGPVWAAKPWRFIFEPPDAAQARPERRRVKLRRGLDRVG